MRRGASYRRVAVFNGFDGCGSERVRKWDGGVEGGEEESYFCCCFLWLGKGWRIKDRGRGGREENGGDEIPIVPTAARVLPGLRLITFDMFSCPWLDTVCVCFRTQRLFRITI